MDDLISKQAAIDALYHVDEYNGRSVEAIRNLPSAQPEPCEDVVPRASVEYICRKNTVSTNPYEHKHHEKFIKFMNDPEIADFGRWQHSNGFNTALVAVKCDLDKVPSVTPKQRWIPCSERLPEDYTDVLVWFEYYRYGDYNCLYQTHGIGNYMAEYDSWMINHETGWRELRVFAWMPLPAPWKGEQNG